MTLVQLRYFVTLAELGSFVKAAKSLFVTQPALSRSIMTLEEELGRPLFDRIGRHIELTSFGQDTLDKARHLLSEAKSLKESSLALGGGQTGHLRIGLSSGPGAVLTTPMLLHMAQEHPKLHIAVSRGNPELMLHALRTRLLDAIIVDTRSLRPALDLHIELQTEMAASFMCREGHPLTQLNRPVAFTDLLPFPMGSTPLSDEVARKLSDLYGAAANPDDLITLRCDEIHNLVEVIKRSNAILLAINEVGHELIHLNVEPSMTVTARFGLITLAQRSEAPGLPIVRDLMRRILHD